MPVAELQKAGQETQSADGEGHGHEAQSLAERRRAIQQVVRDYCTKTFDELRAASRKENDDMLAGVQHIGLNEQEIEEWEKFCNDQLDSMASSAHKLYYEQFKKPLEAEVRKHVISDWAIEEMEQKYWNENLTYKQKESYILYQMPKNIEKWRATKKERDDFVESKGASKLTSKRVPKLDVLLDEEAFSKLRHSDRKGLLAQAKAALQATSEGSEKIYDKVWQELEGYADEGILHRSKVGVWLHRIFDGDYTAKDRQKYIDSTLRPNVARWREVRGQFNTVDAQLQKEVPRGFTRLSESAFLALDYKQRTAYCAMATLRIENLEESNKKLAGMKLSIRHHLNTEDWEGAADDLKEAFKLSPGDRELKSMQDYLDAFTPTQEQKEQSPDPKKIIEDMRMMVALIPTEVQQMYIDALEKGPAVFYRFLQVMFNRIWCHENGHLTVEKEVQQANDDRNKEKTRTYVDEGHETTLERNILDGDTAVEHAIRDECSSPQVLYTSKMGQQALLNKVQTNAENHSFGYWTTVIPPISYGSQAFVVKNLHYPLKSRMRQLQKLGIPFTRSGDVQKKAA